MCKVQTAEKGGIGATRKVKPSPEKHETTPDSTIETPPEAL